MSSDPGEEYLGDDLYPRFDGFAITCGAPREDDDHFVVLEPGSVCGADRIPEAATIPPR
jgi:hypothetical protein